MSKNSDLIGQPSYMALKRLICLNRSIAQIKMTRYEQPQSLQKRTVLPKKELRLIKAAMGIRKDLGLPFWDSIMTASLTSSTIPLNILNSAKYHKSNRGRDITSTRYNVRHDSIEKECAKPIKHSWVAFLSEVILTSGSVKHLPVLDFHCPPSAHGKKLVIEVVKRIFPKPRILLESGKSYHAYSGKLLSTDALMDLLAQALLFAPITDKAYIAHQIIERRASIRISSGGRKMQTPKVVWADLF